MRHLGSWRGKILLTSAAFLVVLVCNVSATSTKYDHITSAEDRRAFVKQMTNDAYGAYVRYAWATDFLYPVTRNGSDECGDIGYTILHSISTLHVMGLSEEFEQARNWIEANLNFTRINQTMSVSKLVTIYIGGLLSSYALTKDDMFLAKAKEFADGLEPAYDEVTGMPFIYFDPSDSITTEGYQLLSWTSAQQLEYIHLSQLTRDQRYEQRSNAIRQFFSNIEKPQGLYMTELNFTTGSWDSNKTSLFWMARDFYITALNMYVQSGFRDEESIETYMKAIDAVEKIGLIFTNATTGRTAAREYFLDTESYSDYMRADGCYLGAMLARGADALAHQMVTQLSRARSHTYSRGQMKSAVSRIKRHQRLAKELTETCHYEAVRTATGLLPRIIGFNETERHLLQKHNYLTSELAQSYFILWRTTQDQKYREYAWQLATAIERHCKTSSGGYSALLDVDKLPPEQVNYQPPEFLSATLKYLYLTFTDDTVLPLREWVFNTVGHPLPVHPKPDSIHNFIYSKAAK